MRRSIAALALGLILVSCGGRETTIVPLPDAPEGAVRDFMNAVRDNDLKTMANVWGSRRGPASTYMASQELEQRLTVMRVYLEHESYEIVPPRFSADASSNQREFGVRITRRGCTATVPFTLARYGDGWLISSVDLAAAGNPARSCTRLPSEPGR
jgi:hypothetical protein